MKKRILSILLVAVMVIPMFVMPTAVSAAVSNDYSFTFEETDVRNAVSGQVFDVAADGEADAAPEVDGTIEPGEYQVSGNIARNTYQNVEPAASLPVKFAVKDGYLYVAFTVKNEEQQMTIQYDIGVAASERSELAWSRKQATWKSDDTTADHTWLIKLQGSDVWAGYRSDYSSMDTDKFLVDKYWDEGVYEAKFDLREYYTLFANSPQGNGVFETPCVTIAIWYAVDNTEGDYDNDESTPKTFKYPDLPGQTHYAFKVSGLKINSAVSTSWVPATVIIPDESLALIKNERQGAIGALGQDYLNMVEGQLLNNGRVYNDDLPTIDGKVNPGEYSASQEYTGSTYTTDGKMTLSYSVGLDGLVYCALTFKEETHSKIIVQPGLATNAAPVQACRVGFTINTSGSRSNQNSLWKNPASNAWLGGTAMWGGYSQNNARCDVSAATTHVDGLTTYEFTLSIPMMIESLEEAGWAADNANGIFFIFFFGSGSVQYKVPGSTTAVETALKKQYGFDYGVGYASPTIALPKDAVERFTIETLEDAEEYFASGYAADTLDRLDAAPSDVVLDGKIGAGEYTAIQEWDKTDVRATDGQFRPGISYDISGKNFVAYDDEYLYFGAEVYDPYYVSGKSQFQLNLGHIDSTKPIDIGHSVRRMNFMATMSDSGVTVTNYGGVLRSQQCNASVLDEGGNKYIGQNAWLAGFNTKKPEVAGSYDAKTKTITYEFKIKIADLEAAFDVEDLDKIYFMTLAVYTDKDTKANGQYAWNFFVDTNDRVMDVLRNWTAENNGGALTYDANMYGHIVNLNREFATREGASVRISTKNAGIRFKTTYTDEFLANMQDYADAIGEEMVIGTLIAPADYIDGDFTHEALGAGRYVEVINVRQDLPYRSVNGVTTYAGSLVNIKEGNLDRDFAGIGFVKIGDEYFYSDTYAIENVSDIATAALEDTKAVADDEYKYPYNGEFSCYGEAVRNVLSKLVAK